MDIFKRRSIRKFTDEKIKDDEIKYILKCAMVAPTAMNRRDFEFLVIQNKETLVKITEFHKYAQMLKEAPLAILVMGDTSKAYKEYWIQDTSNATMNILYAAEELGLGACWLGIHPIDVTKNNIKELFNLPETIEPLCLVAIGHKAEEKEANDFYDDSKVHYEKY